VSFLYASLETGRPTGDVDVAAKGFFHVSSPF
jgi:hypothetical protein